MDHLFNGFDDEDDGDKGGKILFSEAGNVTDDKAGVSGNHDQENHAYPNSNPQSERQVVPLLIPEKNHSWENLTRMCDVQLFSIK